MIKILYQHKYIKNKNSKLASRGTQPENQKIPRGFGRKGWEIDMK
jgi:hypothetical protein